MTASRDQWCDAFLGALYDAPGDDTAVAAARVQPGFAVYRNTVIKACVDALAANFPAVLRLTGADWFRSAAAAYAQRHPPRSASLLAYGSDFPAFLAAAPGAQALPFLGTVATLEQMWLTTHTAADAAVLAPAALARVDARSLGELTLAVHPCARWHWWPEAPILSLWQANREEVTGPQPAGWQGEGVLLTRPLGAVQWCAIGPGAATFLDVCAAGSTLAEAAAMAATSAPELDVAGTLATLLLAGAFTSFQCSEDLPC